ncbi:MAG: hypothetical protein GSR73_06485 [Desulfurococcales archaeon]|nr:hypothetical protein [Desulfurococcales archaeon]
MEKVELKRISEREYEFVITGEDHTLGSLLQHYLLEDGRVVNAYYSLIHPLEESIRVYMKLAVDEDPVKVLEDALKRIIEDARDVREKIVEALKKAGVEIEG